MRWVKAAIFSSLAEKIVGARVLDLFAGSGALGIEALSRGAASALFVDHQRQAIDTMRIKDVELTQSFLARMFGIGDIVVVSSDSTDPRFVLRGVPGAKGIYERLQSEALSNARRAVLRLEE